MEISIYHILAGNLISSVVKLLEKVYLSGKRCIFFSPIGERVSAVDKALWTFSTNVFIPHGDRNLGFCDQQPIYFTDRYENPNNASALVLADTFDYAEFGEDFEKIMLAFDDVSQLAAANKIYHDLKENKKDVNYWKQSPGGWEKVG
jgi:DNA polymerase-3 subunit chi